MKKILLIYPKMGMAGTLVQHIPLSLLYAAIDSIKAGFEINIVDVRLHPKGWEEAIASKITPDTILAGISVMTGAPIRSALEITRWIKRRYPRMKVVWGGPHATFNGREIMGEEGVDFAINGYGSMPLALLAGSIAKNGSAAELSGIKGLVYRDNDAVVEVPPENNFEAFSYKEIPYDLIRKDLDRYSQLDSKERIFSMYSVMGCPYKCAFCSSPAQYKNFKKKYVPIPLDEIVGHIEYVKNKYGATYIYFIDDDSFVDLDHVENIIDEMNKRGIVIRLGFRGARINEISKMSDKYLDKLADVGTNILHIGAESGSQKILDLINKNCTVRDIINVNRKMARHPKIRTAYNWIIGLPGETLNDLHETRKLIMRLIVDNPSALIFMPNKYRPLPSTELYDLSLKYGYVKPQKLEGWIEMESEGDYRPPWYTKELAAMINMMQIASFFIDKKVYKVNTGETARFKILRLISFFYGPIAKIRFVFGITAMLVEYKLFYWFTSRFRE
ncbi:MAG: radical SAM protein [Candidatus Omnitrophota bacterium]|nr:radical SAM protein [Candidatus Omnitrophota bacterium]